MAKTKKKSGSGLGPAFGGVSKSTKPPKASHSIFKMNTDIGQHILKNPGIAQAIVDKSDLKQSDVVLEIGPGSGNLSLPILARCARLTAIELDPRMAAELTKRVQGTPYAAKLTLLLGDVIKRPALPYSDVIISNTPYQISSPLVFKILGMDAPPRCAVLMFQREFAQRLFANPGDKLYSRLSANVQMWAHVQNVMKVGKNNFSPPPMVESSVVRIVPKRPRPQISYEEWDGMLRVCFSRKNKTLRAAFAVEGVVAGLVENWRTWCAVNGMPVEDDEGDVAMGADAGFAPGISEGGVSTAQEDEWHGFAEEANGDDMDVDGVDKEVDDELPAFMARQLTGKSATRDRKKQKKTKLWAKVKEKIRKVLEDDTELAEKRARTCDQGEFLKLLYAFNQEGIHFN
ncbi:rRNA adenine dimethylase [Eremomyces bilateralis CBS 781.70]|uniref:rRNA adenine N(6)-methyltransferase n=1 Tax=Eremomyces bilateralis CBS 781.70 TaxID=1392243 RepID=A0A6G1FYK8_9PEZI|nr:rRNA adenine dimethylase [Eremomyces bilateralis CBS 781.70]KAF1810802.1 rRNA adenine dimethylase [Eremomyces bilateralis CBS 781.70]